MNTEPEETKLGASNSSDLLDCKNYGCDNHGWYIDYNPRTGEAEQVQCEFCYLEPRSKFNAMQSNMN